MGAVCGRWGWSAQHISRGTEAVRERQHRAARGTGGGLAIRRCNAIEPGSLEFCADVDVLLVYASDSTAALQSERRARKPSRNMLRSLISDPSRRLRRTAQSVAGLSLLPRQGADAT